MKTSQVALAAIGSFLFAACSQSATPRDEPEPETSAEALIGGVPIDSRVFDAIGAIVQKLPDGTLVPFCSGTLVDEDAVLTAKHCLISVPEGETVYFATGPDARNPRQLAPIVGRTWDRDVRGGAMGLGSDTAVAHLAPHALRGVFPIEVGTLEASDVGRPFVSVGYGIQALQDPKNPSPTPPPSGTRRAGVIVLRGIVGKVYELTYGSFQGFVDAVLAGNGLPPGTVLSPDDTAGLQAAYDETTLLPQYEAYFGGGKRDAQTSSGDSGGPMLGLRGGRVRVFAVTSGSRAVDANVNDPALLGGIYATLGPESRHLVASASRCGSLAEWGRCETGRPIAERCSDLGEGRPRRVEQSCGAAGKVCSNAPQGAVCAASCKVDADCNAIATGGSCLGGTCTFPTDCKVEGEPFACYLCCLGAHATSLPDAQACVDDCYAAPVPAARSATVTYVPGHPSPKPVSPLHR
ncbi:MAG: trypsin-like serine protease [Polyangiaceae bacterium]|nr:trypsin-like serine protease [Polyangiaceae bacterium]